MVVRSQVRTASRKAEERTGKKMRNPDRKIEGRIYPELPSKPQG